MGEKTSQNPSESKQELDPRIAQLLFGGGGKKGMLDMGYEQAQKPATSEMTQRGRDAQANYLQSPMYTNMVNQMMSQGSGMMNQGIAPNPYSGGSMGFSGSAGQGYAPNYSPQKTTGTTTGEQFPVDPNKQTITPTPDSGNGLTPEMIAWLQKMMQGGGGA